MESKKWEIDYILGMKANNAIVPQMHGEIRGYLWDHFEGDLHFIITSVIVLIEDNTYRALPSRYCVKQYAEVLGKLI
jgi:hypothetical protein